MNYSKYITFPPFHPVCDIMAEQGEYWTSFIPNNSFLDILDDLLTSLQSLSPKDHKSFWVQGTFGSGKSHAAIVIKHLLCDDFIEIKEHAKRLTVNAERFARLQKLRSAKRYLPVTLKGAEKAYHARGAANYIKTGVKQSLDFYGINHHLKTDFDAYIKLLSDSSSHNWDKILFSEGSRLSYYTEEVASVITALKNADVKYLELVEEACAKGGWSAAEDSISIVDWLKEAEAAVRQHGFSGIVIFWDEMTSLFRDNQLDEAVLELIQKIAEVTFSANKDNPVEIYFYMISHKNLSDKNIDKIGDRFNRKEYSMEFVTTYSILSHLIDREEVYELQEVKREFKKRNEVNSLLSDLESDNGSSIAGESSLDRLFPLHPYSAYLCTLIAKNFGSTNRSVFKFIHDDKNGFLSFINERNIPETCTSDYLWRFFEESFKEDLALYGDVLQVHDRYARILKDEPSEVSKVFEVVLLLNALAKRAIGDKLASPDENNICRAFAGVYPKESVIKALSVIDSKDIISRNAMGLYVIESSSLSREDLDKEDARLRKEYPTPAAIIKQSDFIRNELFGHMTAQLYREKEFEVMDMSTPSAKTKLANSINSYTSGYKIKIILIPCREGEIEATKSSYLSEIAPLTVNRNVIVVIPKESLLSKNYDNWLKYKAREAVSTRRGYPHEAEDAKNNANKVLQTWLEDILGASFFVNLGESSFEEASSCSEIVDIINNRMRKPRFAYGAEQYRELIKKQNAWKKQQSPAIVSAVLNASNRDELTKNLPGAFSPLMCVFRSLDNIDLVGNDLKFSPNCPADAPLKVIKQEIDNRLKGKKQGGLFDLSETLNFLTRPPYGLYQNAVSQFILSFCLRDYAGQLFSSESFPINSAQLANVIKAIFVKWDGGTDKKREATLRFGSEEENKFNEQMSVLFDLSPSRNTTQTIRAIKLGFSSKVGAPLWALKYLSNVDEKIVEDYNRLIEFVQKDRSVPSQNEFKEINTLIEIRFIDFKRLLNRDNFQKAFCNFIERVWTKKGDDNYPLEKIKQYLTSHLQEEFGYWEESKTEIAILSFHPESSIVVAGHAPTHPTVSQEEGSGPIFPTNSEDVSILANTIRERRLSVDEYITCLTELVSRYPVVHSYLMSIFSHARN